MVASGSSECAGSPSIASSTVLKSPSTMSGVGSRLSSHFSTILFQKVPFSLGEFGAYTTKILNCSVACHGISIMSALPGTITLVFK